MAPPPEYDKEPKAPDKSATNISCEETKALHNLVNDQQTNLDNKSASTAANAEVENNKHVETLDDGQLRALLDEAITYKCPKDREGKSSLFKELLEEVEQDEQACEAAARGVGARGTRSSARARGRRALPHSNSLQDLVAALAAEPAPRRTRATPAPQPAPVSARAIHGGSLPSGVDTSFLLGEEPSVRSGGAGYLATVRCVNPPPLAERRVSASDANGCDADPLSRRSKPAFPITYTARASLEIGSGSVCSGRAVTTTTASNQVRTRRGSRHPTRGPPDRLYGKTLYNTKRAAILAQKKTFLPELANFIELPELESNDGPLPELTKFIKSPEPESDEGPPDTVADSDNFSDQEEIDNRQFKLLSALMPKTKCDINSNGGGSKAIVGKSEDVNEKKGRGKKPRGPRAPKLRNIKNEDQGIKKEDYYNYKREICDNRKEDANSDVWLSSVNNWYASLHHFPKARPMYEGKSNYHRADFDNTKIISTQPAVFKTTDDTFQDVSPNYLLQNNYQDHTAEWTNFYSNPTTYKQVSQPSRNAVGNEYRDPASHNIGMKKYQRYEDDYRWVTDTNDTYNYNYHVYDHNLHKSREEYRKRVGNIATPKYESLNPRNVRSMSIGKPLPDFGKNDVANIECVIDKTKPDNNEYNLSDASKDNNISTKPDTKADLHHKVASCSSNNTLDTNDLVTECDKYIVEVKNTSVRSSSPINELSVIIENDSVLKSHEDVNIQDDTPQLSPISHVEDCDKGIVHVPVVSQYDWVTISNEEKFKLRDFSCSKDGDQLSGFQLVELASQQKDNEPSIDFDDTKRTNDGDSENCVELEDMSRIEHRELVNDYDQELSDVTANSRREEDSFSKYFAEQQSLFMKLEDSNLVDNTQEHSLVSFLDNSEKVQNKDDKNVCVSECEIQETNEKHSHNILANCIEPEPVEECSDSVTGPSNEVVIRLDKTAIEKAGGEQYILAELPNNACVFLTVPQGLLSNINNKDKLSLQVQNDETPNLVRGSNNKKKKKDVALDNTKKNEAINKKALKTLLFQNLFKSDSADKSISKGLTTITKQEVDSAIPFSCITTPEVVASCNTTSSALQSAVAVDPKPLQLGWSYNAVSSLAGMLPSARPAPRAARSDDDSDGPPHDDQPRSVIANTFNGLPLSRPNNYGSTGATSQDEYKKSLDENGNSVQGFSSPLSGSSQHKKPRRKKSSKNETVIKSHQIDGYQGNKDLNEVLRFIESNADSTRAHKLGRAKHKDDSDEKGGKKRSTERRKDKESKMKRATSMEELSRTKLEDLTDKPGKKARGDGQPAKAERRSWGDDAREPFYFEPEPPADEFQTVTKKRKPRRRADLPPRRPPSPRARRVSAPPSERSNDSNDDLDSVHSLPAEPAPRLQPASYADIARAPPQPHNIPDLIESCNFYAEEARAAPRAQAPPRDYPALEPRRLARAPPGAALLLPPKDSKPPHAPPLRRDRKPERCEVVLRGLGPDGPGAPECPAPDVVADRRPPVILLDSAARHHDMDGVTFGFDINEQLLGGPQRRPRCDLVRDAMECGDGEANGVLAGALGLAAAGAAAGGALRVCAGGCALRYRAPAPPPDTVHLHQIIDYVGAAWDDIIRCGGGKVRYFSE